MKAASLFDVHGVYREDGEKTAMTILYLIKDGGEIRMSADKFGSMTVSSSKGIAHDLATFASAFDIVLNRVHLCLEQAPNKPAQVLWRNIK